ncbi:MAG: hypothetical protein EX268_01715 [Deltaproteobacteria bacterium]|nr:MAG: hypothetical protein EX268_01715 [Deltaproteobacteria bacterium]
MGLGTAGSRLPEVPQLAPVLLFLALFWPTPGAAEDDRAAFLGHPDRERIEALRTAEIAEVSKGKGGRSLAFKITLTDGTEGYFKPKQTFSAAHWYSELAAYYLDRELGMGRVPPTTGRRFRWSELRAAAGTDSRVSELGIEKDGTIKGAFIWWIPERLERVRMGRGWERWVRVQKSLPITPYQRPVDYRADLNRRPGIREATDPTRPVARAPDIDARPAELSDLIVFDYLTQNVDRWGGDFTNVRSREKGGPLIYLDNGAGFWLGQQRLGLMEARLKALQRFRRSTIDAVRALDIGRFASRLREDPLAPVLNEKQLDGLERRRRAVLGHVEDMVARFGEARVFAW